MGCKMKAMIMDMCTLSHKTQCFFDVRTCRRRRRGQTEGFARRITIPNRPRWFVTGLRTHYYIPLINPTVNQLINQLSYHQSAINPIKSSFLVGKITFFFTGLHLVTITTLPRTATPQMVRANTTDALQLSSVWPQEVLTLMWGWVKLPCTPLN